MFKKVTCMLVRAILLMILCTTTTTVVGDDTTPIPEDISKVDNWFSENIKPYTERKATLDPALVTAEDGYKVIKVMKNGGDFKTITDAINSIPTGNTKRAIIYIEGGVYQEKIKIERTKPFITFYGSPNNMPSITFAGTAAQYGTVDSATLIVESDYFSAVNVIIKNSAPKPDGATKGAQAVAFRISGDKAAFYNCKIIGFQDTLCDDRGFHFFKDCHIEGTVDFIFGSGTSLYLNTDIQVIGDQGLTVITAHARENEKELTGYSFVHGKITGSSNGTYLGRAWKSRPRVVYSYTSMSNVVHPDGWSDNFNPQNDKTVFYGEYKCMGPGSNLSGKRVEYTKKLSDEEVKPFLTLGYILGSKWLLPPPNPKI